MDGEFKIAIWKGTTAYLNQRVCKIEPKDNRLLKNYLYYFLPKQLKQIEELTPFVTVKHLSVGDINAIEINLPPPKIQLQIVSVLDKAQTIINKRKNGLQLLDQLLRDSFLDMFGDLEKNPQKWPEDILENLVKPHKIITYGIVQAGPQVENGVPYIKSGDIKNGKILINQLSKTSNEIAKKFSRSSVHTGDIIFSIRASVGTAAILPKELDGANLTQGTARISVNEKLNNQFLYHQIQTKGFQERIQRQVKGTTFKEITLERLRKVKVLVPDIKLQEKFANRASAAEKIKEQYIESLSQLESLFQSILQKAFKGELEISIQKTLPNKIRKADSKTLEIINWFKKATKRLATTNVVRKITGKLNDVIKSGSSFEEAGLPDLKLFEELMRATQSPYTKSLRDIPELKIAKSVTELPIFKFNEEFQRFESLILKTAEKNEKHLATYYESQKQYDPVKYYYQVSNVGYASIKSLNIIAIASGLFGDEAFSLQTLQKRIIENRITPHISIEELRIGLYKCFDDFLTAEYYDQPFTFQQLHTSFKIIKCNPDFNILNEYLLQRLQNRIPSLKQAYFDEQMKNINENAYQYLIDTMDRTIVGENVFTVPRRLFLVYSLPILRLENAT